jgi:hypothetical protein
MAHNIICLAPQTRVNDLFVHGHQIDAQLPVSSITHPLITGGPNDPVTRFQAEFYKHIACDIVVETVFDYPYPYVSEKSLRAFACKRMMIVLGPVGVLELLRSKGFKTFGDIIDESYDKITNPTNRFNAVTTEIKKICNTPIDTIKNYMRENSHKFEHNFLTLKNLQKTEIQQIACQFNIDYDSN